MHHKYGQYAHRGTMHNIAYITIYYAMCARDTPAVRVYYVIFDVLAIRLPDYRGNNITVVMPAK